MLQYNWILSIILTGHKLFTIHLIHILKYEGCMLAN